MPGSALIQGVYLALFLAIGIAAPPLRADQPVAFVYAERGAVDLLRAGQSQRLRRGQELLQGDRVVTETDSRVLIALNDGSTLALGGASRLRLAKLLFDKSAEIFNGEIVLDRGILRAALSHRDRPRSFLVATPSAVLSIDGADWIMEAGESGTAILALRGQVRVTGGTDQITVTLAANEGTEVEAGAPPTAPARWGQARIERAKARTTVP